jgi:hypothetical protein
MTIYLFNPENNVYLGEDFVDEALMKSDAFVVPANTTTIAPPKGGRGHTMIFDAVAQCWEVHSYWQPQQTTLDKPQRTEIHYYSGSFLVFIGFLLWFAALCDNNKGIGIMCGLSLILGSAAYISLKERIQDPNQNSLFRKFLELSTILFIVLGYLWELCTININTASILINSVTPITSIALYLYCLISYQKSIQVSLFRSNIINNIHS